MSDQSKLGLGSIITTEQQRDAIHVAIAPVEAAENFNPGDPVKLFDGVAISATYSESIGVVDPFLFKGVKVGQRFWMYLKPGSITSLRHDWTHPAFDCHKPEKSESELWMRRWAVRRMLPDLLDYGYANNEDQAYDFAIRSGYEMNVGPCEDSRDHIDQEWWAHWEKITGDERKEGCFSCAC